MRLSEMFSTARQKDACQAYELVKILRMVKTVNVLHRNTEFIQG
jgi:hypothetical protein